MTKAHSQDRTSSEAIAKFWNRYIHAVEKSDVFEYQIRWYVIRAKEYVKTNRDTPLRDQNPGYISRYLEELGSKKPCGFLACPGRFVFEDFYNFSVFFVLFVVKKHNTERRRTDA